MKPFRTFPRLTLETHNKHKETAPKLGIVRRTDKKKAGILHDEVVNEVRIIKDILYAHGFMEQSSSTEGYATFRRGGPQKGSVEILTMIHSYILEHGLYCGFEYVMALCGRHGEKDYVSIGSDGNEMVAKCVSLMDIIEEADDYFGVETMKQLH